MNRTRLTKNNQKVASLEEQNKFLAEVLKACKEHVTMKDKEKTEQAKEKGDLREAGGSSEGASTDRKCKAKVPVEKPSPTKKARTQEDGVDSGEKQPETQKESGRALILEYPDYEANREDDFDEGQSGEF